MADLKISALPAASTPLVGTEQVVLVQSGTTKKVDVASLRTGMAVREQLTAARSYYVRTDGSDSNTGLENTSGGAFLTIQKAVDTVASIDLGIHNATISVGAGTYTTGATLKPCISSGGTPTILGDATTPSNVLIDTTGNAFFAVGCGRWSVNGFKVQASRGVYLLGLSFVDLRNIDYGVCTYEHIYISTGAVVRALTSWTVSGSASAHVSTLTGGSFSAGALTCTLTGTPAFSFFCMAETASVIIMQAITFSGSATGGRYQVTSNAVLQTYGAGATYLPGSIDGSVTTGGQYV